MATEEPSTSAIDETPISPVERVNSLEKHLQTRPEVQDLKNRNILHDTSAAPALQAAQLELERNRTVDSLKKGLERRPERDELVAAQHPPRLVRRARHRRPAEGAAEAHAQGQPGAEAAEPAEARGAGQGGHSGEGRGSDEAMRGKGERGKEDMMTR